MKRVKVMLVDDHALAAQRSGALRYVPRQASSDELIRVIQKAASGLGRRPVQECV